MGSLMLIACANNTFKSGMHSLSNEFPLEMLLDQNMVQGVMDNVVRSMSLAKTNKLYQVLVEEIV